MSRTPFKYEVGQHLDIGRFHGTIKSQLYNGSHKAYEFTCDKCGCENTLYEYHIEKGVGCSVCDNKRVVVGINDIPTTAPWMIPYFQGGREEAEKYTCCSAKKIIPKCPFCGRVKKEASAVYHIYNNHGIGCVCKDGISVPNKFIFSVIEQLFTAGEIGEFKNEKKADNEEGSYYYYDMYFKKDGKEYVVEMDGRIGHGYIPSKNSFVRESPKAAAIRDFKKDDLAEKNGWEIIRIDADDSKYQYLKQQIEESELRNIVNLELVDWNKVFEFASKNIIKEVCDYKNKNPNAYTTDTAKIFHIGKETIREYWIKGTELGWCYYNGKAEIERKNSEPPNRTSKWIPIEVRRLSDNTITQFLSLTHLERESKELYGFTMYRHPVKDMIDGKRKFYEGYEIIKIDKGEN